MATASCELGNLIRELRERRRLSQRALAELAGVTTVTVGWWERGVHPPSLENTIALSKALRVSTLRLIAAYQRDLEQANGGAA